MSNISKFNDWLAERLSYILSIMATFYVISMLVIIPLFYSTPNSIVGWAQYLCSVVFQGIALPVLGYTAKKASDKSDKMLEEMYKMTRDIELIVKHLEAQQDELDKEINEILEMEQDTTIKNSPFSDQEL